MLRNTLLACLLVPSISAPGPGQVLFEDDFSQGLEKWGGAEKLQGWRIQDEALARPDPNAGGAPTIGDDTWTDYVVEFRLMRTEVLEGGHNGIHVRAGDDRRCHIFLRPTGLRYEMPPVTETRFGDRDFAPEVGRWYQFRIIVHGRDADVEVDDVYQGTISGLNNARGGIAFVAYRVALKLDDVRVTAIPPAGNPPPRDRPEAALDIGRLNRATAVHIINTSAEPRVGWPVVCRVGHLGLPADANLTSLAVFADSGEALPLQLDDTDLSGDATPADELCFALTLPPLSVVPLRVKFDTSQVLYTREQSPALVAEPGKIVGDDYAITWGTETEEGETVNARALYRLGSADGPAFFSMAPWPGETTVALAAGPVRTLWVSRAPLEADGVLSRRVECYRRFARVVARLAPEAGKPAAGIRAPHWGGVGAWAYNWGLGMIDQIEALRWRDIEGYREDPSGNLRETWFPEGGGAPHLCMDLGDRAVAIFRETANDYDPGAFLVGRHAYYAAHIHFGWRAPIMVWADAPSITRVTLVRTDGGREAFELAERQFAEQPLVLDARGREAWVRQQAALVRRLREAAGDAALPAPPKSLAEAVQARAALRTVDLDEAIAGLDADRRQRIEELERRLAETTPARALLRRMQPLLTAARWDWNVGRYERAAERLAWARRLRDRAEEAARQAPAAKLVVAMERGPIVPYVTIAGRAKQAMADLGLTVSHDWLPWAGGLDPPVEDEDGRYDWQKVDELVDAVNATGMTSLPLINFNPPTWFGERYGDFGHHDLVDPGILGYEPEALQHFGRWIDAASKRFERAERIMCWSVRNEPAYLPGGAITSPLMLEAFRKWLASKYRDIADLNRVWEAEYASFEEVESPTRREDQPAAWYDMAIFKAEAIAGELGWEADIIQRNSRVKLTGAKYVPTILDTGGVRAGMGPDPWTGAQPQRGVALCDLYTDSDWQTYRLASELWFATGGCPVISAETGLQSRPQERRHRWVRCPDQRQRSFAWSALQFGLYGMQFWSWGGGEEYGTLNWDGTVPDDAIWVAMANQERLAAADLLSTLKPITHIGLYYPQATFIDSDESQEMRPKYSQLFNMLADLGYQVRNFSFRDIDRALKEADTVILPPAPYVEAEIVPRVCDFVQGGGTLLAVTEPAIYDEHLRPLEAFESGRADLFEPGKTAVSFREVGEGRTALIADPVGLSFGQGKSLVALNTTWRFRFGLKWPQQGMAQTEPPAGAEDRGMREHWEAWGYDDSDWDSIRVPGVWEERGYPDLDGYGWYRLSFDLAEDMRGRRVLLSGETLDDRAWVYVNGALVHETQSWDSRFQVDVTKQLRPGDRNVIALRILDHCFVGGVRGRLALTSPDIPSDDRQLLSQTLRALGAEPEAACTTAGVVRRLMVDGAGGRHLLYTNETGNDLEAQITVPVAVKPSSGQLMNLLEGQRFGYRTAGDRTVIRLRLGPHDTGILPLKAVEG